MLDASELRSLLSYDAATGQFVWLAGRTHGKRTGCVMKDRYRVITINTRMHYEHRLAWLYEYGEWPADQLDHKDGDRQNNRLANLRECTAAENAQNRVVYRNNKTGYQGVCKMGNRYLAQIKAGPQHIQLGFRDSPAEAHLLYLEAKAHLHQFQPEPRAA